MKPSLVFLLLAVWLVGVVQAAPPPAPEGYGWVRDERFSDEFNGAAVDTKKWDNNPNDWGVWSWEPENAYLKDGNLRIRMQYAPHQRGGQQLFYKSGISKSREAIQYGYFEARIKGCSRFPGVCPAFWVIGNASGLTKTDQFHQNQNEAKPTHALHRVRGRRFGRAGDAGGATAETQHHRHPRR